MRKVDVSVVIVNFNTFELTSECIASVLAQTTGVSYEVILVDNGSTECDANGFSQKFPNITLIESKANLGFAKGNNLGIERAVGDYILLLNSDTLLLEDSISICVDQMRADPKIGALSSKLIYPDGVAQPVANAFPSIGNQLLLLSRAFKLLSPQTMELRFLGEFVRHERVLEVDWIFGAFFLTSRDVLKRLPGGKLSETFFMYYEDVEWCYEIKRLGLKIRYFPETSVVHYGSASQKKTEDSPDKIFKKVGFIARNEALFLRRTKGWLYQKIYSLIGALVHLSVGNIRYALINLRIVLRSA